MKTPHLLSNSFRLVYRDTGMKALALIGIVMILLANIVMYAIVQQIHFIEISVMMLLSYVGILLLVKSGRSQLAITIYMLSGLLAIMRFGQFSYESFLIVTTALLAHVMTVFVLQTRKRWMLTMVIALVSIVTVGSWHALEAPTSEIREYRTLMTITQTITFLAGAAVVRVIYMLFINLNDRTENAIEALREQKVLLEQRSAEFEAANLALVQSESRYRTLVEGASEAILLVDFPSWRVLDGNVSAEKLFKISRDEMLKATITDFVMGPTTQLGKDVAAEDFIDAFVQGEALTFEQVHADSAGREFLCQVRLMMLPGEPNRARATVVDISEQRASEIQIRELAERLQLVSDNVPVRIAYFDATLNLQFWNRSFGHTFGLSDDKPPLHAKAAFGEALFDDYTAYLATALAGEQVEFESHGAGSDDDTSVAKVIFKPHVVNHKVIGIFAVALDISAERKAQRTLSKTSNLLQAVTDNMPARLIYVDHKNKIRFLNRRYEEFGVDISAALGQSPDEALPASMRTITGNLAEGLSVDERIKKERTIVLPSGEERIENIVVMPHIVDAIPQGYIVLVSDVTELRRAEAAFQQAQKTESLGVLAGGIAHDFNNLLVAILGQSAIASAKLSHEHPAKRHLDKAIQASERAALLTNQMLAYSGRGAFSVESLNLNKLIEDNLALFRVSVPPTSKFNIDLCDSLPLVDADPAQMQQVIMNLINVSSEISG